VTITDAQAAAVLRLRAAGCVFAEDEAAVLAGAAGDDTVLAAWVERRVTGEPLEQVVGFADFDGLRVRLQPGVFVPRRRSELLVRIGAEAVPRTGLVVDLCCGSGALGLAVRRRAPGITLHAADLDPAAVACARENFRVASNQGTPLDPLINVHHGDLFEPLPAALRGRVDLLLANVPYVATRHLPFLPAEARDHEPRTALDGGDDGLAVFRAVAAGAHDWLAPSGLLLSEITEAQTDAALTIAAGHRLTATVETDDDLDAFVITAKPEAD
jgi:release factor glutamine methyltransferase